MTDDFPPFTPPPLMYGPPEIYSHSRSTFNDDGDDDSDDIDASDEPTSPRLAAKKQLSRKEIIGLELQRLLRKNEAKAHTLKTLFWECTLRCNLNCRHCGSDCKASTSVPDMPAEDFLRVIDSITPHVDPHRTFIIITGGEALLRNDIEQVGAELYRRGYPWGMVTNGMLLNVIRLQRLVGSGMHSITISLDGFANQHNWIRRNQQSFARACDAVKILANRSDLLWDVVTCVNRHNIDSLPAFKDCLVEMGVPAWRLFSISPMGRAVGNDELQLSDQQFVKLLNFIEDSRKEPSRIKVSYACEGFLGQYERHVRDLFFYCRSGIDVASIRCDGAISGCTSVRSAMDQGNIYTDDFWDVWQNRFSIMRDRKWAHRGKCASCEVWRYCEGSGMHLYDNDRNLLVCHYQRIKNGSSTPEF